MKKYISAILINALLLQLVGCYTQKEITYDEFCSMPNQQKAKVILNDEKTVELSTDSLRNSYMYWWKGPDTLTIYSTHLEKVWSTALKEVTDTIHYPKEEITKVYIDEYDQSKTIFAIVVPVAVVALFIIIAITSYEGPVNWQ